MNVIMDVNVGHIGFGGSIVESAIQICCQGISACHGGKPRTIKKDENGDLQYRSIGLFSQPLLWLLPLNHHSVEASLIFMEEVVGRQTVLKDRSGFFQVCINTILTCPTCGIYLGCSNDSY